MSKTRYGPFYQLNTATTDEVVISWRVPGRIYDKVAVDRQVFCNPKAVMFYDDDDKTTGFTSIFNQEIFSVLRGRFKYYEIMEIKATASPASTKTVFTDYGITSTAMHLCVY